MIFLRWKQASYAFLYMQYFPFPDTNWGPWRENTEQETPGSQGLFLCKQTYFSSGAITRPIHIFWSESSITKVLTAADYCNKSAAQGEGHPEDRNSDRLPEVWHWTGLQPCPKDGSKPSTPPQHNSLNPSYSDLMSSNIPTIPQFPLFKTAIYF